MLHFHRHAAEETVRQQNTVGAALLSLGFFFLGYFIWTGNATAAEVIELTQTPCQFVEPEGGEKGFTSTKKADCVAINAKNGESRVEAANVIMLKSGDYVFRVTNKNVPYPLGFWLRESDYDWKNPLHKLTKISVSGGGLTTGKSLDYEVSLKPGEYVYSCPLNTTPDYKLVVSE